MLEVRTPHKDKQWILQTADAIDFFLQVGAGIAAYILTATIANLRLQTQFPYQNFTELPNGDLLVVQDTTNGPPVFPGYLLASMCMITAIQHFISFFTIKQQWPALLRGFNWIIWPEYAITSAMMTLAITWLLGNLDFSASIALSLCLTVTNLIGFQIEWDIYKNGTPAAWGWEAVRRVWFPFAISSLSTLAVWGSLWTYFIVSNSLSVSVAPWWVWFAFLGTFFQFNNFAVNFAIHRVMQGRDAKFFRKYPWLFALNYRILSITSKLNLTVFFFLGTINRT